MANKCDNIFVIVGCDAKSNSRLEDFYNTCKTINEIGWFKKYFADDAKRIIDEAEDVGEYIENCTLANYTEPYGIDAILSYLQNYMVDTIQYENGKVTLGFKSRWIPALVLCDSILRHLRCGDATEFHLAEYQYSATLKYFEGGCGIIGQTGYLADGSETSEHHNYTQFTKEHFNDRGISEELYSTFITENDWLNA